MRDSLTTQRSFLPSPDADKNFQGTSSCNVKEKMINKFAQRSSERLSHLEISNIFFFLQQHHQKQFHRYIVDFNIFLLLDFMMFK